MAATAQPLAFEQERLARIERNRQLMAEMNLPTLASELGAAMRATQASQAPKRVRQQRRPAQPRAPGVPVEKRRSGRLANVEPVEYCEAALDLADGSSRGGRPAWSARAEESYTEAHVQALGSSQEEWELFVDGYDAAGNRVYDKANGQTCHQCRQKTLGLRTACAGCASLRGVFCGDCLYMRYGENVREVNANPTWTCPSCRDICNCSICRNRKGWAPTGCQYPNAIAAGFKSVAHFIILSNVAKPAPEEDCAPKAAPAAEAPAADASAAEAPAAEAPAAQEGASPVQQQQISALLPARRRSQAAAAASKLAVKAAPQKVAGLGRATRSRASVPA